MRVYVGFLLGFIFAWEIPRNAMYINISYEIDDDCSNVVFK